MISNQRKIAWSCLLASLLRVAVSFSSTAGTSFIPTTRVTLTRYSARKDNSSAAAEDHARKKEWGSTGSSSLAGSESGILVDTDNASFVDEPSFTNDVAEDLVVAAMLDPTDTDAINYEGVVMDISGQDGSMASSDEVAAFLSASDEETTEDAEATSESISVILVAAEAAAAAAEAKLSKEESELVPLIPVSNDTVIIELEVDPAFVPASQVVGEPITFVPVEIDAPDVKKILKFAIPAIGVWLCGPILSLIDTSAVGLFCGTFEQAALSPAVAVTDYAALLIVSIFRHVLHSVSLCPMLTFPCEILYFIRHSCTRRQPTWLQPRRKQTVVSRESHALPRT
jgi:hypothetical protein